MDPPEGPAFVLTHPSLAQTIDQARGVEVRISGPPAPFHLSGQPGVQTAHAQYDQPGAQQQQQQQQQQFLPTQTVQQTAQVPSFSAVTAAHQARLQQVERTAQGMREQGARQEAVDAFLTGAIARGRP